MNAKKKKYKVVLSRSASREVEHLPKQILPKILQRLTELESTPFPPGIRKIRGAKDLWRLRVGDYRIIYRVNSKD